MQENIKNILNTNLAKSVIIIIAAIILYNIMKGIADKTVTATMKIAKKDRKKQNSVIVFNSVMKYIFGIVVLILLLEVNGVNVSSLIASLGIVGIVVGLAIQDALKDLIAGKNIISDHFFEAGDVIKYNGITGKVISLGLKTTKLQDLDTNDIVSITNRHIEQAEKVSDWLGISIPAPYEKSVEEVESIMPAIVEEIKSFEHVKDCKYIGIGEFTDSSVIYKLLITCSPEYKLEIKRQALRTLKIAMDKAKISIPYTQIDIHQC